MSTVLHKDSHDFAIVTTAEDERSFREQFAMALSQIIEDGKYDGDWYFQLEGWLAPAAEIFCRFRGYKAAVVERRTIVAGVLDPDEAVVAIGRAHADPRVETPASNGKPHEEVAAS